MTSQARLIADVAAVTEEPVGIVEQIVIVTFAAIRYEIDRGNPVVIDSFGRFWLKEFAERHERQGDEVIVHPPYRVPGFKAAHEWRKVFVNRRHRDRDNC